MVPWTRPTLRFARSAFPRERVRSVTRSGPPPPEFAVTHNTAINGALL
jgi:hypothetical protein